MSADEAYADRMGEALDIARGLAALAAEARNADIVAMLSGLTDEEHRMLHVAQTYLTANYAALRCASLGIDRALVPDVIRSSIGKRGDHA